MPGLNFYLSGLDVSGQLDVCGNFPGEELPDVTGFDATAKFKVTLDHMEAVFRFQSDSSDVDGIVDNTDTQYYVKFANGWKNHPDFSGVIINPAHALMVENPIATGFDSSRNLVKHDFVRHIAKGLFNTHKGVDLLQNEDGLKEDIAHVGSLMWADISNQLGLADIGFGNSEGGTPGFLSGADDLSWNFTKRIMRHIKSQEPERFNDISGQGLPGTAPVPLEVGDKLIFKATFAPADGQELLTLADPIPQRTYKIELEIVDGVGQVNAVPPTDVLNDPVGSGNGAQDGAASAFNLEYNNYPSSG